VHTTVDIIRLFTDALSIVDGTPIIHITTMRVAVDVGSSKSGLHLLPFSRYYI